MIKEKVLILGSSGFIGSNFVKIFNRNLIIKKKFRLICSHDTKKKKKFNFFSKTSLNKFINIYNPRYVFNFTGQISNNKLYQYNTVLANYNLIKICNKKKIKILLASSDHVYDNGLKINYSYSSTNPSSNYGKFKKKIEDMYFTLSNDYKILRISNIYDYKLEKNGLLKNLKISYKKKKKFVFQNGKVSRNFIHLDDVLRILFIVLNKYETLEKVINISHENFKLFKIADFFNKKSNYSLKIIDLHKKDQKNIKISNHYIVKELKYKYKYFLFNIIDKLL